jgi:hypothetical protein
MRLLREDVMGAFVAVKIVREYERGVVFRLGRLVGARLGPVLPDTNHGAYDAR